MPTAEGRIEVLRAFVELRRLFYQQRQLRRLAEPREDSRVPDAFNENVSLTTAINIPFPQAIPSAYVVDIESCLGHNPIICGKCREKCEKNCIDFNMSDELLEFDVGTIIVATGMEPYDPTELDEVAADVTPGKVVNLQNCRGRG